MSNDTRIARMARLTAWVAYLVMAALAVMIAAFLTKAGELPQLLGPLFDEITMPDTLGDMQIFMILLLGVLVLSVSFYAVYQIYLMAGLLRRPPLLKLENAEQICSIGVALLVLLAVTLLAYPALVLTMTWANPTGERSVAISIGFGQVTMGLVGSLIYLIGRSMIESAKEAEEFRTFI